MKQGLSLFFFGILPAPSASSLALVDPGLMQTLDRWQHGSPLVVLSEQKWRFIQLHWETIQQQGLAPYIQVEMMALLGLIVGKLQLINRIAFVKSQLLKIAFWVFPLTLLLITIACLPASDVHLLGLHQWLREQMIFRLADYTSTPFLSLIYLTELSLLVNYLPTRLTQWISNTGRLSLTNYLIQSLLCMGIFYGYGMGLSGKLTLLESLVVVVGVYLFQVVYSNLWLQYFKKGPLEQLRLRLLERTWQVDSG